jgi:hypothetical protein
MKKVIDKIKENPLWVLLTVLIIFILAMILNWVIMYIIAMIICLIVSIIVVNDKNKEPIVLNHKLKPFDITFTINSIDEAKMLILMFESSPTIFKEVIEGIKKKVRKQGYTL